MKHPSAAIAIVQLAIHSKADEDQRSLVYCGHVGVDLELKLYPKFSKLGQAAVFTMSVKAC